MNRQPGYLLEGGKIITLAEHDARIRRETLEDLEQRLKFWDDRTTRVPRYAWDCINAMKEKKE